MLQSEIIEKKPDDYLRTIAAGAAISLFFGAIGYGLMFTFRLLAARYFGPANFGYFEMANTILNIAGLVALIGIHGGVSRYIAIFEEKKQYDKLSGYLSFIFKLPMFISLIVSTLLYFGAGRISDIIIKQNRHAYRS